MFNLFHTKNKFSLPQKDLYAYHRKSPYNKKVYDSILDFVGNTPLIKLNRIPKDYGISCDIYAKCDFMNPAGSSKDKITLAMLNEAEKSGNIRNTTKFVEPTSGNTGIGIAFNTALIDKECYIVMTGKNSKEKENTMRVLGADVIITSGSMVEVAREIKDADPDNIVMLDQFENHVNPKVHYETTGLEILEALDKVDMLVLGAGTGGTITGAGQRIKEKFPKCTIVAAEPDGSTMFNVSGIPHPYLIEGIGGVTVPIILDKSVVDDFEIVTDEEAFLMAREIIRKEGLLCGGSSGAAMVAAIKAIRKRKFIAGQNVVIVLPDGIRNYMSKFVTDQWMEAHLFIDPPQHTMKWWKQPVTHLTLSHTYPIIGTDQTCAEAIHEMMKENIAIVVEKNGYFAGAVTKDSLRSTATNPIKLPHKETEELNFEEFVSGHLVRDCYTLAKNSKKGMPTIGLLSRILDITQFVVIGKNINEAGKVHFVAESVATADDVLHYIFTNRTHK